MPVTINDTATKSTAAAAEKRLQEALAADKAKNGGAGALESEPRAMDQSFVGILRNGLYDDLGVIATRIGAGKPVPIGYAAMTIGAAVGAGAIAAWLIERAGVRGPLPVAAAAVLGGLAFDVVAERLARAALRVQAMRAVVGETDGDAGAIDGAKAPAGAKQPTTVLGGV